MTTLRDMTNAALRAEARVRDLEAAHERARVECGDIAAGLRESACLDVTLPYVRRLEALAASPAAAGAEGDTHG